MKGTAKRMPARSPIRFRITSYLQLFERQTCSRRAGHRVHSSHSSFSRRSFFEPSGCRSSTINDRGYSFDSNEVETGEYSGSWLLKKVDRLWLRFEGRHFADRRLSTLNHQLATSSSSFPPSPSRFCRMIGPGKSYPVTAAQLLPNLTGIPHA